MHLSKKFKNFKVFFYYYVKVYVNQFLKCIMKKVSNYSFSVKIVFKQGLQVLKTVNYVFFTHLIDSKFLWYVHNIFIIKILKNIFLIFFLQSKIQKIKKWLWLLMVHVSTIPPFYGSFVCTLVENMFFATIICN